MPKMKGTLLGQAKLTNNLLTVIGIALCLLILVIALK